MRRRSSKFAVEQRLQSGANALIDTATIGRGLQEAGRADMMHTTTSASLTKRGHIGRVGIAGELSRVLATNARVCGRIVLMMWQVAAACHRHVIIGPR